MWQRDASLSLRASFGGVGAIRETHEVRDRVCGRVATIATHGCGRQSFEVMRTGRSDAPDA